MVLVGIDVPSMRTTAPVSTSEIGRLPATPGPASSSVPSWPMAIGRLPASAPPTNCRVANATVTDPVNPVASTTASPPSISKVPLPDSEKEVLPAASKDTTPLSRSAPASVPWPKRPPPLPTIVLMAVPPKSSSRVVLLPSVVLMATPCTNCWPEVGKPKSSPRQTFRWPCRRTRLPACSR
jgi:hypothetical protein